MSDGRPVAPPELQIYNSYEVDPRYQVAFTIAWTSALAVAVVLSLPSLLRSGRTGRLWDAWRGISEDLSGNSYVRLGPSAVEEKRQLEARNGSGATGMMSRLSNLRSMISAYTYITPPLLGLDLGQILVVVAYLVVLLVCITHQAHLVENGNRAGFMALAQLPMTFLFATKNSVVSVLVGNGYEKLNFIHRWSGRGVFLAATIHGSLWINNHLHLDPAQLRQDKEVLGLSAFSVLGVMMLLSLRPVRARAWQVFFYTHVLGYVSFFIIICYHTPYAQPWIFPPLAFYAFDLLLRMFRYRIKDATLSASDSGMTLITVADCDSGWVAGQHVRLRVFVLGRIFESHPLTILNAPRSTSVQSAQGTILLGARAIGDWSKALNALALQASPDVSQVPEKVSDESSSPSETRMSKLSSHTQVTVMMDGPYGALSIDLGQYETVFLVAGGAGVTFTLGILDDIVGRIVKLGRRGGERTKRIEFSWYISSFGCIFWFAQNLKDIAEAARNSSLELRIHFFVTCFCNPDGAPVIPNSRIVVDKPSLKSLLQPLLSPTDLESSRQGQLSGGLAICASGPSALLREAHNEVASLGVACIQRLGGVGIHTEPFAM